MLESRRLRAMVKPWPKIKNLKDYEWKRDKDEDIQNPEKRREVPAVLGYVEKDKPWYSSTDSEKPAGYFDEAVFQEEDGIKEYRIARRLVKIFENGDHVILDVVGCCTVLGVVLKEERT